MVFQSFSLYPHMTVYENIAFPLRATRMSKADVDKAVREIAKVLRITDLLGKKPSALSGGDMQRVAIGRALVRRPKAMWALSNCIAPCKFEPYRPETVDYCGVDGS